MKFQIDQKKTFFLIFFFLTIAFVLLPNFWLSLTGKRNDSSPFKREANQFTSSCKRKDAKGIYRLFNPTFKKEISEEEFKNYFEDWLRGKRMKRVETKFVHITGLTAQVSTWIWEDQRNYQYLFANWIKTDSGWRLFWLSPILPDELRYGDGEIKERKDLLLLAIERALEFGGFKEKFPQFTLPKKIIFLKKGRPEEGISLTKKGNKIFWLTGEEIEREKEPPPYYFDFGAIRILDNIATVYLDIIPIKGEEKFAFRQRGLQFQFKKTNRTWQFVGYGAQW